MVTINDLYKRAVDNGVLKSTVTQERFEAMLADDNQRKRYYDYAQQKKPSFYSLDFDIFSKNVSNILSQKEKTAEAPANAPAAPADTASVAPATPAPEVHSKTTASPQNAPVVGDEAEKEQALQTATPAATTTTPKAEPSMMAASLGDNKADWAYAEAARLRALGDHKGADKALRDAAAYEREAGVSPASEGKRNEERAQFETNVQKANEDKMNAILARANARYEKLQAENPDKNFYKNTLNYMTKAEKEEYKRLEKEQLERIEGKGATSENVSRLFDQWAETPQGKQAVSELREKENDMVDKYVVAMKNSQEYAQLEANTKAEMDGMFDEYKKTQEYKSLIKELQSGVTSGKVSEDEANKRLEDAFYNAYKDKIEEANNKFGESVTDLLARLYGEQMKKDYASFSEEFNNKAYASDFFKKRMDALNTKHVGFADGLVGGLKAMGLKVVHGLGTLTDWMSSGMLLDNGYITPTLEEKQAAANKVNVYEAFGGTEDGKMPEDVRAAYSKSMLTRFNNSIDDKYNEVRAQYAPEKGFIDLLESGRLGDFSSLALFTTLESAPQTAMAAFGGPAGFALMAGMSSAEMRDMLARENPDVPVWKKTAISLGAGIIEQAIEKLGNPFTTGKMPTGEILDQIVEFGADGIMEYIIKGGKRTLKNVAKAAREEGGEEILTSTLQDAWYTMLDIDGKDGLGLMNQYNKAKEEAEKRGEIFSEREFARMKSKEYVDSYIGGFASGAVMSLGSHALQGTKSAIRRDGYDFGMAKRFMRMSRAIDRVAEETGLTREEVADFVDGKFDATDEALASGILKQQEDIRNQVEAYAQPTEEERKMEEAQAAAADIDAQANREDGNIYAVTLNGDTEHEWRIVGGDVEVVDGVIKPKSEDTIITIETDGMSPKQVKASDITLVADPISANDAKAGLATDAAAEDIVNEDETQPEAAEPTIFLLNGQEVAFQQVEGGWQMLNADGQPIGEPFSDSAMQSLGFVRKEDDVTPPADETQEPTLPAKTNDAGLFDDPNPKYVPTEEQQAQLDAEFERQAAEDGAYSISNAMRASHLGLETVINGWNSFWSRKNGVKPQETTADTKSSLPYGFSDEIDENGKLFVNSSKGTPVFGEISAETGLTKAPILLSEGIITNPKTNDGYGLVHIEARHGEQIRKAGYASVVDFVEEVAKNWQVIRKGNDRQGNETYLLQLTDKHDNTLIIELSSDGTYWNINTAGIFKSSYGNKKEVVYTRPTTGSQPTTTGEVSQVEDYGGETPTSSRNDTPTLTSGGKGTTIFPNTQEKNAEMSQNASAEPEATDGMSLPAQKWNRAQKIHGVEASIYLNDGTEVEGEYILAPAFAITPSHDPFNDWKSSEGFPTNENGQNINDRDYEHDKDARSLTEDMVDNYGPQAIQSIPVVSNDGIPYSGNCRTIAGQLAAKKGTDSAYLTALRKNAHLYGFTKEQVDSIPNARLVFVPKNNLPYTTEVFAQFNKDEKKTMDNTNQAISFSKSITDKQRDAILGVMDSYETLESFFGSAVGCHDMRVALVENGVITENELPRMTEKTVKDDKEIILFNGTGKDFITNVVIGSVFGEKGLRRMGSDKGLKLTVCRAISKIIENRQNKKYSLFKEIDNAITLIGEQRKSGMILEEYLRTGDVFNGYVWQNYNPFELLLSYTMSKGVEPLRTLLGLYNSDVSKRNAGNANEVGMFDDGTRESVMQLVIDQYLRAEALAYQEKVRKEQKRDITLEEASAYLRQESIIYSAIENYGKQQPEQRPKNGPVHDGIHENNAPGNKGEEVTPETTSETTQPTTPPSAPTKSALTADAINAMNLDPTTKANAIEALNGSNNAIAQIALMQAQAEADKMAAEEAAAAASAETNDVLKDLLDLADDFVKGGSGTKLQMTIIPGLTQDRLETFGKMAVAAGKLGYVLAKQGFYKFEAWKAEMKKQLAPFFAKLESLGWNDAVADEFITDAWDSTYVNEGEAKKVSDWAKSFDTNNEQEVEQPTNDNDNNNPKNENNNEESIDDKPSSPSGSPKETTGNEPRVGADGVGTDGGVQTGDVEGPAGSGELGESSDADAGQSVDAEGVPGEAGVLQLVGDTGHTEGSTTRRVRKEQQPRLNERNYLYSEDKLDMDNMTPSARKTANIEALETLATLIKENRDATDEEKDKLALFRGWGGLELPNRYIMNQYNRHKLYGDDRRLYNVIQELDPNEEKGILEAIYTSALTSYYTPLRVASAINSVVAASGYKGNGVMLDPSMGNGIFEGTMSKGVQQSTSIHGIELDWLTGQIAKRLYPDANVKITGLQDAHVPMSYYDVVMSNIPFGDISVTDTDWSKSNSDIHRFAKNRIHNYFAVKMIESTKPGGLCVIMTSNAIMDTNGNEAVRKYIAENCEIIGAVRLPDNTFKGVGTRVVTDVIYLRKYKDGDDANNVRNNEEYKNRIEKPFLTVKENKPGVSVSYNSYYESHEANMIGEVVAGGQYSENQFGLTSDHNIESLSTIISELGQSMMDERKTRFGSLPYNTTTSQKKIVEAVRESYVGNGNYEGVGNITLQNGKAGKISGSKNKYGERDYVFEEDPVLSKKDNLARVTSYIPVRTALKKLIAAQINNESDEAIGEVRTEMQNAYNTFVKKYGRLWDKKNDFIIGDIDGYQVCALEKWKDGKFVGMADIFTKNTISSKVKLEKAETPHDAVLGSLTEHGEINPEYMEKMLGENWLEQCGDLVYELPTNKGVYETAERYLSGDVVTKLAEAEEIAKLEPQYEKNVEALKSSQPKRKEFGNFPIHMGAGWIAEDIYEAFMCDVLGISDKYIRGRLGHKSSVKYFEKEGSFVININDNLGPNSTKWNGGSKTAKDIFKAALTGKDITVYKKDEDGKIIGVDQQRTERAREKTNEMRDYFVDWVGKNPEYISRLTNEYNNRFNRVVVAKWNGSHLSPVGLQSKTLRPHQKDAVWMLINQKGGIVDHIVGAGKSLVMMSTIMEMRRMGIAKKPMIIALKSTVQQIAKEFREAYPSARILAPVESEFAAKKRKAFLANIAVNDYDCIVLSHDQFSALEHSEDVQKEVLDEMRLSVIEMMELYRGQSQDSFTKRQLKGLQKRLENLDAKVAALNDTRVDREYCFENLGVDYLMVDESQQFKNLAFNTIYSNVAGLGNPTGSERSYKLMLATRFLQGVHGGDMGTVFLSGTTISNSLTELYNIFNYLRPNKMKSLGLNTFDAWANTFAVRSTELEFDVTNDLKERTRFRTFEGLQELSSLYKEIADVRNDKNLTLPKPKEKAHLVTIPITDQMKELNDAIINMLKTKNGSYFGIETENPEKYPWSLVATNLAKLATLSPKLIDEKYEDENGKIKYCCDNIASHYRRFDANKGLQLVFCDSGVPSPGKKYDAYHDIINRLVNDYGIPKKEIAYVQQAKNDNEKAEIFRKACEGEIRILIGGTNNLGTGVNVQPRITAMHHMDIPWTPASVAQRNGRGCRQGNWLAELENSNTVDTYYYAMERTLDTYKYQLQDTKGKMIESFKNADPDLDSFDEGGSDDSGSMNPAEMMAILSGNPIILDKSKQDKLVERLKRAKRTAEAEHANNVETYKSHKKTLDNMNRLIELNAKDIEQLKKSGFAPNEKDEYPVLNVTVTDVNNPSRSATFDKAKEAGDAILKNIKNGNTIRLTSYGQEISITRDVGINGFTYSVELNMPSGIKYTLSLNGDTDPVYAGQIAQKLLKKVYDNKETYRDKAATERKYVDALYDEANNEFVFNKQAQLDEAVKRKAEIDREYKKLSNAGNGEEELSEEELDRVNEREDGEGLATLYEAPNSESRDADLAEELKPYVDEFNEARNAVTPNLGYEERKKALQRKADKIKKYVDRVSGGKNKNARVIADMPDLFDALIGDNVEDVDAIKLFNDISDEQINAENEGQTGPIGLNYNGKSYLFAENISSLSLAQEAMGHEEQHSDNKKNPELIMAVVNSATPKELYDFVTTFGSKKSITYRKALNLALNGEEEGYYSLADEAIAYAMSESYKLSEDESLAEHLRSSGIKNEKLITILDNERKQQLGRADVAHRRINWSESARKRKRERIGLDGRNQKSRQGEMAENVRAETTPRSMQEVAREAERIAKEQESLKDIRNRVRDYANKIAKDGEGRANLMTVPTREDGESISDYSKRISQFYKEAQVEKKVDEYTALIQKEQGYWRKKQRAFTDVAAPVMHFQEWIKKQGGKVAEDANPYQDMFLSRSDTAIQNYFRKQQGDVIEAMRKILDSKALEGISIKWRNIPNDNIKSKEKRVNGKKLTPRELLGMYALAKDCEEAASLGLPDRGAEGFVNNLGITHTDLIKEVEDALTPDQIAEFWKATKAAASFALDYQLAHGYINKETRDLYTREYYVPQRGWSERDKEDLSQNYVNRGGLYNNPYNAALRKAKGRTSLASDPFAFIDSLAMTSIMESEENVTKQKLLKLCQENEEIGLQSNAFHAVRKYVVQDIDETTGKSKKETYTDEDGEVQAQNILKVVDTPPSADDIKHDKAIRDQIAAKRGELAEAKKAIKESQKILDDIDAGVYPLSVASAMSVAAHAAIASNEKAVETLMEEIEDLGDQLHYVSNINLPLIDRLTANEKNQHIVNVLVDGQLHQMWFRDVTVPNTINKQYKEHVRFKANQSKVVRAATRFMAGTLTQYNPEFALANFSRDLQVAATTIAAENGAKAEKMFFKNFGKSQSAVWRYVTDDKLKEKTTYKSGKMGDYLKEYFESGAQTGYSFMQDIQSLRKEFDKELGKGKGRKVAAAAVKLFAIPTEWSETSVRLAGYVTYRQLGKSADEAAYLAKELTTNFQRGGYLSDSAMFSLYTFLRASINGNIKYVRAIAKNPKAYSVAAAAFMALGLLNALLNPDDPEKEVYNTDYTAMSNFTIGNVKIPVAHFMRMFFAAGVNFGEYMNGSKSGNKAMYDALSFAADEMLPQFRNGFSGVTYDDTTNKIDYDFMTWGRTFVPSVFSPVTDVLLNRDFIGRTINGERVEYDKNKKDILKYRHDTDDFYIDLVQGIYEAVGGRLDLKNKNWDSTLQSALDNSPAMVQHVVEGYMPAAASTFAAIATVIEKAVNDEEVFVSEMPFIRRFYSSYRTDRVGAQEYWLLEHRIEAENAKVKDAKNHGTREDYKKATSSQSYKIAQRAQRSIREMKKDDLKESDIKELIKLNNEWNEIWNKE